MVNIMSTENHKDEIEGSEPEKDLHSAWTKVPFEQRLAQKAEISKEMSMAAFILTSPIYKNHMRR